MQSLVPAVLAGKTGAPPMRGENTQGGCYMAQTEHLGLHQWEASDSFLRTDFNEDFAKIDAAVGTLQAGLEGVMAMGVYRGNAQNSENVARLIEVGFTPRVVVVKTHAYVGSGTVSSTVMEWDSFSLAVAATGAPQTVPGIGSVLVEVAEGGFQVGGYQSRFNRNSYQYLWFALR